MTRNNADFHRLSARQILDTHELSENVEPDAEETSPEKLLKAKYSNATKNGLKDDILQNGITSPIKLLHDEYGNKIVFDGHHRLAVAMRHFPDATIPVKYVTWENND